MKPKKFFISIMLAMLMICFRFGIAGNMPYNSISLSVDGEHVDCSVVSLIVNDRCLFAAYELLNYYNIPYEWNNAENSLIIKVSSQESIQLIAYDSIMLHNVNGRCERIVLDSNMIIKDGTVFIPIRAISDMLGYTVDWHSEYRSISVKTKRIIKGEQKISYYTKYLNKSKSELENKLNYFNLYTDNLRPFYMYTGVDGYDRTYGFGFMEGIDRCCLVETDVEYAFPGLTEIYDSYESIDRVNIERYIGKNTILKVDNLYGYYLEYEDNGSTVRVVCNKDGSTYYTAALYVTQKEPAFSAWLEKENSVQN